MSTESKDFNSSLYGWSERAIQGFTIAATVSKDPQAASAAPGLSPEIVDSVLAIAKELASLEPNARRQRIRQLTSLLSPRVGEKPVLIPRAQALIARAVSRKIGQGWIRNAKPPRPGYRPEPALVELIKHIAVKEAGSENWQRNQSKF